MPSLGQIREAIEFALFLYGLGGPGRRYIRALWRNRGRLIGRRGLWATGSTFGIRDR